MTRPLPTLRATRTLAVIAALALAGCATKTVAPPPPADTAPAATSAAGAVKRFAWGLNHKDLDIVAGLITDDFVFISAGTDSAGDPSRDTLGVQNRRDWFLSALIALVDSSSSVSFVTDQNPVAFPDSRPGRNAVWHKQVRTSVSIVIHGSGSFGNYELTGNALFFATRGDSAAIPAELVNRGVKPDSTRWWLDRYEDETLAGSSVVSATDPAIQLTFGALLAYFLGLIVH